MFEIELTYYFLCAIGAFVLYFTLQNDNSFVVLAYINPNWKNSPWCRFFEAIIFTIIGAFVATLITAPTNPQQALVAGMGWTGILKSLK